MKLIFFPDVHNNEWFEKILKVVRTMKESKIISLGDIAAVKTKEFLKNKARYHAAWKYKKGKEVKDVTADDVVWFDQLNTEGWNKQMDILDENEIDLTMCRGNSDYAMLDWYKEKIRISKRLTIIDGIEIFEFDKITLVFLPYNSGLMNEMQIAKLKSLKLDKLYVLSHCPPMKESNKEYYKQIYANLKMLGGITKEVVLIHGHMHPEETYKYGLEDVENIRIIAPKSNDTEDGIGSYNNIIELDTESEKMRCFDLEMKEIEVKKLPEKYYLLDKHWNNFDL